VVERRFGLDREANFEGAWHLHVYRAIEEIATDLGIDAAAATARLDEGRATLLAARTKRVWPGLDDKILTSWNGLAISGLARASRALARDDYADAALRAARFLRERCWQDGRLLAVHAGGESRFPAYLDDYAALAWVLLDLLEARWDAAMLDWAIALAEVMLHRFADDAAGGFFFTANDHEALIVRPKTFSDDATPAGNGLAARVLLRLGYLLAEPRYLDAAEGTLRAARAAVERYPHGNGSLLLALEELTAPPALLVLRGPAADLDTWRDEIDKLFDPRRMVVAIPGDAQGLPPALADKRPLGDVVAYVCRGMTCSAPVRTLGGLLRQLQVQ
jgi:hypothetical protein